MLHLSADHNQSVDEQIRSIAKDAQRAANELASQPEDEAEPYKHLYQADEALQAAISTLNSKFQEADYSSAVQLATAELLVSRGVVLLDTDLLAEAQQALEKAIEQLKSLTTGLDIARKTMQHAHNALGRLFGTRSDHDAALAQLTAAEDIYKSWRQQPSTSKSDIKSQEYEEYESNYTTTLFYLAQVAGHAGLKERSALYCAASLQRQYSSGDYQLNDWVQNCLQLAGYFVASHAYAISEYFLLASDQVVSRAKLQGKEVEDDVAANLHLAWARHYMSRLDASHKRFLDKQQVELPYPDVSHFPDHFHLPELDLPAPDRLPWGELALARDFDGARDLFNLAMPHFKAALSYYQLDGFVTDYIHIQLDVSNIYRCLAGFESDPHRKCVMHKSRTKSLEPLWGDISAKHYESLVRSIDLELASIYTAIAEVKESAGWPAAKVAASAESAVKYYTSFLKTFEDSRGQLPQRVDVEDESLVLGAVFQLGHMLHKAHPGQIGVAETAGVEAAYRQLRFGCEYVRRNSVAAFQQEAALADELATLMAEKINLVKRKAAVAGNRAAAVPDRR